MLDDYLDACLKKPWKWGTADGLDCCSYVCGWIMDATGRDVFAPYRGKYGTARAARRLVHGKGGLAQILGAEIERHGFNRAETPEHGDIGIVAVPEGRGEDAVFGASAVIRYGPWWVGRNLSGFCVLEAPASAIWRIL